MTKFRSVELNLSDDSELLVRLVSFQRNAAKLKDHWDKLDLSKHLSFHISQQDDGKRIFSGDLPDEPILEGIYMRFRLFILNDDEPNFYRLLNLLSSASNDKELHALCRLQKKLFLDSELFKNIFAHMEKPYNSIDIINYWFYSYYFHDQEKQRDSLSRFKGIVSDHGAKLCLWYAVFTACQRIFYLKHILRDTSKENPLIYVPMQS
jgi:hypothetical protein